MSYEQACAEVKGEIASCIENSKKEKEIDKKIAKKCKFKEEFEKLKDGNSKVDK